jgi:uncharacterized protein YbjT (DUF2867 family)
VLLLTGATGIVGSELLQHLVARGHGVRALVRDPRRLGAQRVRVQIALGDLADPQALRTAVRGVDTVVHLAASVRDQPHATVEELTALATWRLLAAAEQSGVRHFVFVTALGATPWHASRVQRARALAEQAVTRAGMRTTTFATSLVYAPGDRRLRLLERLALLPVVPVPGLGRARSQPIWSGDVAACIVAALEARGEVQEARHELAGPQTLTQRDFVAAALAAAGHPRPLVSVPVPALRPALRAYEALTGPAAFATWDEVELLGSSMLSARGTADAEALGVQPRAAASVLGR